MTENGDGTLEKVSAELRRSDQALVESERRYRVLVEDSHDLVWAVDAEGRFTFVNQAAREIYGMEPEELIGRRFIDFMDPVEAERSMAAFAEAIEGNIDRPDFTSSTRRPDGSVVIMSATVRVVHDGDGNVAGCTGTARDITARLRAEESARSQAALLLSAQRIGRMGSWSFDVLTGTLTWDDAACELFGLTRDGFEGTFEQFCGLVLPEDRPAAMAALADVEPGRGMLELRYRIRRADGEIRCMYERGNVEFDADGAQLRRLGMVVDVTELRAADRKLREQAQLLDKAQDAILVRDLEHRVLYWNKSAERLYGHTAVEVMGRPVEDLLYLDPADFFAATDTVVATGEWIGELEQRTKDGAVVTVEGRWTLVHDEDGTATSILAINTDITNRKRLEQQFIRAQRLESIGTLAGGIAHDLNNVLAPIIMSIELLKDSVRDDAGLEVLDLIRQSAERGADMVRQVLSFARGMEGKRMAVHLKHTVHEIMRIARDTFPKDITITDAVSEDLWLVEADPTQLHQVLLNLCVNARDAMPAGGALSISVRNLLIDEHYAAMNIEATVGPYVTIEVEDNGSGIAPELLERVFDPFFTTKEIGKGTGLGLATTLAIVKGHGGFIRVYSDAGSGTRFRTYLPARPDLLAQSHLETQPDLPRGNGELILVVDDEPSIRHVTQQTLETFGYRVLTASDGSEAVSVFVAHRDDIALVLTDMMMPVMDGRATIKVLRRLSPDLPIIGASGLGASGSLLRAANSDVKQFLSKPYSAEALLTAIRDALRR